MREFNVRILVDENAKEGASSTERSALDMSNITVRVVPPGGKGNMADTLAHELGHVVGQIFNTPGYAQDPRNGVDKERIKMNALHFTGIPPEKKDMERIVRAESEAWDFAEKMRRVGKLSRSEALGTYEQTLKDVSREGREKQFLRYLLLQSFYQHFGLYDMLGQ